MMDIQYLMMQSEDKVVDNDGVALPRVTQPHHTDPTRKVFFVPTLNEIFVNGIIILFAVFLRVWLKFTA